MVSTGCKLRRKGEIAPTHNQEGLRCDRRDMRGKHPHLGMKGTGHTMMGVETNRHLGDGVGEMVEVDHPPLLDMGEGDPIGDRRHLHLVHRPTLRRGRTLHQDGPEVIVGDRDIGGIRTRSGA